MQKLIIAAFIIITWISCRTAHEITSSSDSTADTTLAMDSDSVMSDSGETAENDSEENENLPDSPAIYNPSFTIINDLVNTTLDVRFNVPKTLMYGKAWITLKPHFYPTDSLTLDAKGFDINEVALMDGNNLLPLKYSYDSNLLKIQLNKSYQRDEQYKIYVDYISKPNRRKTTGSPAITDTKGLYFINPEGKDPNKPTEIWTQGETEYNSAWFPTIDKPDMKTTIQISMTVDTAWTTLSNGLMISSKKNNDGSHTDTWKMDLPIAPYLVMMAAGKFFVYHDHWKNIPVDYYVDPKYAPYAKDIFGHTPEMIEFYSKILGLQFVWPKYSQVVVHDFVSGAMENATATVHMEGLEETHRELIDHNYEDYICHELFHHWFGDLVTCESWANIPLNESFANFSEMLWLGHKYGKDCGDEINYNDMKRYLTEMPQSDAPLIRYGYSDKEDMFDAISYEKGGRVLNMLRNYVGDSAFFKSLNLYLNQNKFGTGEVQKLRLAFEQITGEDLNWFFNQWFLSPGHPKIDISYDYNDSSHIENVTIEQMQNGTIPLYRLPMNVDVYVDGNKKRYAINDVYRIQTFQFPALKKPDLVNVDADKVLLCEKTDEKSDSEFIYQYYHAPLFVDRIEAVSHFDSAQYRDENSRTALLSALRDKYYSIRLKTIHTIDWEAGYDKNILKSDFIRLASNDSSSKVRAAAIDKLDELRDPDLIALFQHGTKDSSYLVIGQSLLALSGVDSIAALSAAKQFTGDDAKELYSELLQIYSQFGDSSMNPFFIGLINNTTGVQHFSILSAYGTYLARMNDNLKQTGLTYLYNGAEKEPEWIDRMAAMRSIMQVQQNLADEKNAVDDQLGSLNTSSPEYNSLRARSSQLADLISTIEMKKSEIKSKETNATLKMLYNMNH
jgi:aminopeptidase N